MSPRLLVPRGRSQRLEAHRALYRWAARGAGGQRALDLGCGTGYGCDELMLAGAEEVVGIDVDPRCVRYARRRFSKAGALFEVCDLTGKPDVLPPLQRLGAEGGVDLAVCIDVLQELEEPDKAVATAARLLNQGGRFIATFSPSRRLRDGEWWQCLISHFRQVEAWSLRESTTSATNHHRPQGRFVIERYDSDRGEPLYLVFSCRDPRDPRSLAASEEIAGLPSWLATENPVPPLFSRVGRSSGREH